MTGDSLSGKTPRPDQETAEVRDPSHASALDELLKSAAPGSHPKSIGPWKILETLGEGGMGIVYLAEQTEPVRRRVALKLIKLGMDTREVLARFDRERQALALMDHPNIARVLDAGAADDGRPYFVMELVRGLPLTEYCDRHKLPLRERLVLFEQVCHAVQHAHHKGIIHRDLKPSNILVSSSAESPIAKIIDFGVARAVQRAAMERSIYTELGQMIGTPAYMSPEQADMTTEDVDTRSDIYSLGVVLYELLVGVVPFETAELRRAGFDEMRRIIREVEPPPPSMRLSQMRDASVSVAERRKSTVNYLAREIRGDLDWITLKALEKDRTRRYATASELAADIERYLNLEPVLARRSSAIYVARKLLRRHRRAIGAAAAVIVLATLVTAVSVVSARTAGLEARLRVSREHLREGERSWLARLRLEDEVNALHDRWREAARRPASWVPVWERTEELEAYRALQERRAAAADAGATAEIFLTRALEAAPGGTPEKLEARRLLEKLYWRRYQDALEGRGESRDPTHLRLAIEKLGLGTYRRQLEGRAPLSLRSEPAGAEVYCFRFAPHEGRLVPLPFDPVGGAADPGRGFLGRPLLEVDRVWPDSGAPFQVGDRLLEVAGASLSGPSDLAASLARVLVGASVRVRLRRGGEELHTEWVPFPESRYRDLAPADPRRPGRLVDLRWQLGLSFAACPLEFHEGARLGTTREDGTLEVELPEGSYLLVFRKAGHLDCRFPAVAPGSEAPAVETVRLHQPDEVPPGFVAIPAGPVAHGGDGEAFQSLPRGVARVGGFFISRFETTTEEYLRFVNDPEVFARTDDGGLAEPGPEVREALPRNPDGQPIRLPLIPRSDQTRQPWWERREGAWRLRSGSSWTETRPVLGLSYFAALEYAAWRNRQANGRWRFRLPSDLEWEKAARGVDRRIYPWGDYLVWSFCYSKRGIYDPAGVPAPDRVGAFAEDESVYGIRDMAGSLQEPTTGLPLAGERYVSMRGGHWNTDDAYFFRLATRNGLLPEVPSKAAGIRLVAEPVNSPQPDQTR